MSEIVDVTRSTSKFTVYDMVIENDTVACESRGYRHRIRSPSGEKIFKTELTSYLTVLKTDFNYCNIA